MHKYIGNANISILQRFIKPRTSIIFGYLTYSPDRPVPSILVSGPHEDFSNSAFGICIGRTHFSDGRCRPISMHKVWRYLLLRHNIVEHVSILRRGVAMIWAIVVPGNIS